MDNPKKNYGKDPEDHTNTAEAVTLQSKAKAA
jgi:hypothetical protein